MTTSDGISDEDWKQIEDCAANIVTAVEEEVDKTELVGNLFKKLDLLEEKYGRVPSILATRADYVDDARLKLSFLKEAYTSALELNDEKNTSYIAASLAEYYMENVNDPTKVQYWWRILSKYIESSDNCDNYLNYVREEVAQYLTLK